MNSQRAAYVLAWVPIIVACSLAGGIIAGVILVIRAIGGAL